MLDGRAHLLAEKSSTNLASAEFLQGVSQYQSKIDSIHKAVEEGDVRRVKSLIDRSLLATARDRHGQSGAFWQFLIEKQCRNDSAAQSTPLWADQHGNRGFMA